MEQTRLASRKVSVVNGNGHENIVCLVSFPLSASWNLIASDSGRWLLSVDFMSDKLGSSAVFLLFSGTSSLFELPDNAIWAGSSCLRGSKTFSFAQLGVSGICLSDGAV